MTNGKWWAVRACITCNEFLLMLLQIGFQKMFYVKDSDKGLSKGHLFHRLYNSKYCFDGIMFHTGVI